MSTNQQEHQQQALQSSEMLPNLLHLVLRSLVATQYLAPNTQAGPDTSLEPNQALLKLEALSFSPVTINSVLIGERKVFWDLFPTGNWPVTQDLNDNHKDDNEDGDHQETSGEEASKFGRIPIYGISTVVSSTLPGLYPGSKIYGQFPIASYSIRSWKFSDVDPTVLIDTDRSRVPDLLNLSWVIANSTDVWKRNSQAIGISAYPMYFSGYMLTTEYLAEGKAKGWTAVITDAATLTSVTTAHQIKKQGDVKKIVGLVKKKTDKEYVKRTGLYDVVYDYNEYRRAHWGEEKHLLIDFSNNREVLAELQRVLGDRAEMTIVGGSPSLCAARPCPPDHGPVELPRGFTELDTTALYDERVKVVGYVDFFKWFDKSFESFVVNPPPGLNIVREKGWENVKSRYEKLVKGSANANEVVLVGLE
ncbi:hypothetical protein BZA77DRAFT_317748 [Pyronema omphalodes]|nr:hypothetical protein BZA77DRAFT_317748 [Pyronema omphalodes]